MIYEQPSVETIRALFNGFRITRTSPSPLYWFEGPDPKISGLLGLDTTEFSIVHCDHRRGSNYRLRMNWKDEGYDETRSALLRALSDLPGAPAEWGNP